MLAVSTAVSVLISNLFGNINVLAFSAAFLVLTVVSMQIYDRVFPKPKNLTSGEVKTFFESKIFWLAVINLIAVVANGLFKLNIDPDTQASIVSLDWSNIGKAVISLLLIVIRKVDILKMLI